MAGIRFVAVVDIGKTNAKLAVFDLELQQEISRRTAPNHVVKEGLYPHSDVDALWAFICGSLRQLAAESPIDAISITTHGASAALLAQDGSLALPVLDYEHAGPEATATDYNALRPPFSETGSPRLPNGLNLGAQIDWQARSFAEAFAHVRWIVTYPQYWAFRLCGVVAGEITSLGCHTDLWNMQAADYSALVDRQNWRGLMPPLRRASDRLGHLLPEVAHATGLAATTPVFCGIHDSNASLYPHLLNQAAPFSVVSTGTWVVCMAIGGAPVVLDATRDTLINVNALGQTVPSARFMGGREFQLLQPQFGEKPTPQDQVMVLAAQSMLLPAVVDDCGPFVGRKAQWLNAEGLTPAQTEVVVSFYLALMAATCLQLIGAQGPVVVEGPFAANDSFMSMLSAATGCGLSRSPTTSTGTTQGAAMLCLEGQSQHAGSEVLLRNENPHWASYAAQWLKAVGES